MAQNLGNVLHHLILSLYGRWCAAVSRSLISHLSMYVRNTESLASFAFTRLPAERCALQLHYKLIDVVCFHLYAVGFVVVLFSRGLSVSTW